MKLNKKISLITLISSVALLGFFCANPNSKIAKADSVQVQVTGNKDEETDNTYGLKNKVLSVLQDAEIDPSTLTKDQIEQLNKINFSSKKIDSSTKWTYAQYSGVAHKMINQTKGYKVPYFNAKKLKICVQLIPEMHRLERKLD